jgi:hypothetical protein
MNSVVREPSTLGNKRWFQGREDWAALFVAPLMILGGFLNFVFYHRYNLLAPETLIAFSILVGSGLIVGLLTVIVRSDRVRVAFFGLLLIVFCDIQFGLRQVAELEFAGDSSFLRFLILAVVLLPATLAMMALRRNLATILVAFFVTFLIATIVLPSKPVLFGPQTIDTVAPAAEDLPPIVHLILDGHIGVEGIPQNIEGGPELRQALVNFYLSRGFRVFGRAYSRYFLTRHAIASLFNPRPPKFHDWLTYLGNNRWSLHQNRYFDRLSDEGFLIRVYQNDYMNFCQNPATSFEACYKYPAASPRLLSDMDISVTGKSALLISASLDKSAIFNAAMELYDKLSKLAQTIDVGLFPPRNRHSYTLFSLGALDVVNEVIADIATAPKGRVYFVHLLLPHAPYIFLQDCRVRFDVVDWRDRRLEHHNPDTVGTIEYREAAYKQYFAQTHCLMKTLDRVFDALKQAGVWDESTIILHGDHGSRITLRDPFETHLDALSSRDMIDSYSTFYAIRSPDFAAGYDGRTVSIQDLFAERIFDSGRITDEAIVHSAPNIRHPMRPIQMVPIGPDEPATPTTGTN